MANSQLNWEVIPNLKSLKHGPGGNRGVESQPKSLRFQVSVWCRRQLLFTLLRQVEVGAGPSWAPEAVRKPWP